ncbi:MAG: hypothetical protein HY244_12245 [Rhizobiales bacterium]|nr:hypothetical protein [Hyphomicrobiales bacterium]
MTLIKDRLVTSVHIECIEEASWLLTKAAVTNRIARSIFVALLAVAIATLPATVGSASVASAANVEAAQAMPDCDHHRHSAPSGKTQKFADEGACLAACAIHCFSFTGLNVSSIAFSSLVVAALKPLRAGTGISALMGSPPFRPPRV